MLKHCETSRGRERASEDESLERICEVVAVLLNNSPENIEAHFGIPMTGAVLNPLNYRLDARTLNFMLGHSEAKMLIVDREYSKLVAGVLDALPKAKRPFIVDVDDPLLARTLRTSMYILIKHETHLGLNTGHMKGLMPPKAV